MVGGRSGTDPATAIPASSSPPVIGAMTGVRALALFAVLAYHLHERTVALLPGATVLDPWMAFAFFALDVFFMLSGFVISYNYAERLADGDGRRRRDFFAARFARIYPVHILTFAATAALVGGFALAGTTFDADRDYTAVGFVGNVLMLQSLPGIPAWNGPAWSIPVEVAAYLVFPFVAGLLLRTSRRAAIAVSVLMVCVLVVAIQAITMLPTFSPLLMLWARIVCDFTVGCLLWVIWRHGARPGRRWDAVALGALVAVGVIIPVAGARALTWIAVGFLAIFLLATASATGVVRAFLASTPVEYSGRISYSVYLVHYPVLELLYDALPYEQYVSSAWWVRVGVLVTFFAVPLVVGVLVYQLVEEPARRWLRRRATRTASPPTSAPGSDGAGTGHADPRRVGA